MATAIDWPSTLPQDVLQQGYQEDMPETTIRTQMDEGPAKIRRWGTAAVRNIKAQQTLTTSERAILDTFFNTTIQGGSLRFNWVHPVTKVAAEFRFTRPPVLTAIGADVFTASYELEIMP